MVHFIGYTLRTPADYEKLVVAVKKIPGRFFHLGESKWLIDTVLTTQQVRDLLAPFINLSLGDMLFVDRIYNNWAACGLTQAQLDWLKRANFGSAYEGFAAPPAPSHNLLAAPPINSQNLSGNLAFMLGSRS